METQVIGAVFFVIGLAGAIFAKQIQLFCMRIFPWEYREYRYWSGASPAGRHWIIRIGGIFAAIIGFLFLIGIIHPPPK